MIDVRLRQHFAPSAESAAFTLEVEFHAGPGSTVLFGPSGAGKTLTLDAIAGFRRPAEGRISVAGVVLFDTARGVDVPPRLRQCGYVFQNYALFPHMTLRENLEFAASRSPRLERHRRVVEMLDRFRLGEVAGRRPHELSGGQKQRCSIARALLANPRVLLLDEPARGLDASLRQELYTVLRQVRAEFATPMLAVTHDADECFELGDEMIVLDRGRVAQVGAPRKVVDQPASLEVARQFGFYNLLPVEIRALDPSRDSSVVRFGDVDLAGPYFPGRFIGDRVTLFVRTALTGASPRNGRPGQNQVPVTLERASDRPGAVRLEFSSGIVAEVTRAEFERGRHSKEWVAEFPQAWIRVL